MMVCRKSNGPWCSKPLAALAFLAVLLGVSVGRPPLAEDLVGLFVDVHRILGGFVPRGVVVPRGMPFGLLRLLAGDLPALYVEVVVLIRSAEEKDGHQPPPLDLRERERLHCGR